MFVQHSDYDLFLHIFMSVVVVYQSCVSLTALNLWIYWSRSCMPSKSGITEVMMALLNKGKDPNLVLPAG